MSLLEIPFLASTSPGRDRAQCWRKSDGFDRRAQRNFISGPARCGPQQASQSSGRFVFFLYQYQNFLYICITILSYYSLAILYPCETVADSFGLEKVQGVRACFVSDQPRDAKPLEEVILGHRVPSPSFTGMSSTVGRLMFETSIAYLSVKQVTNDK